MVSNHGRASVDFAIASAIALPKIAEKFGNKLTVLVDSGFKTGNDVFKALALGAKGAGFAGSMLLALAADRAKGVEALLTQITLELRRTMAIAGCPNLESVAKIPLTHIKY